MPATIAFAGTHHDPDGLLETQTRRILPLLREWYTHMTVVVTASTNGRTREFLQSAGVYVYDRGTELPDTLDYLGLWRRKSLEIALDQAPEATHLHFCDFDRILHWAERYPDELQHVLELLPGYDFTVLGRTTRAFRSHPRVQYDTESIINHTFSLASGHTWDVTAASRGLSRRAARRLVDGCDDDTIGNDCSWPLFLLCDHDLTFHHVETEGLEFETLDRYSQEELAAAGGVEGWLARIDTDPRHWLQRLDVARMEAASVVAYRGQSTV